MRIRKIMMMALVVTSFASTNVAFAIKKYPKKTCQEIYTAIGTFLKIADNLWKSKDEEKAAYYAQVAANYATIYETVCRK